MLVAHLAFRSAGFRECLAGGWRYVERAAVHLHDAAAVALFHGTDAFADDAPSADAGGRSVCALDAAAARLCRLDST